jgi:8-oxo-dGTP diphosphatase
MVKEAKVLNVVAGLIYRDGKLLVCQRRKAAAFALKWEFPGGKIEAGESAVEALRRELKEELDIEVREVKEVYQCEHVYAGGPRVRLRFFCVAEFTGTPKNLVFEQICWSELSDLDHFDFLAGDQPLVRRLASDGDGGLLV